MSRQRFIAMVVVGLGTGCTDELTTLTQEQKAPGPVWPSREILDNGDAPLVYGCQAIYGINDTTCAMNPTEEWGDRCDSATKLKERVVPTTCNQDPNPPAPKEYDCTVLLNDPKARCVVKDNVCTTGNFLHGKKSARCEIPKTDNPAPTANDYCVCPVKTGETIVANECPTLAAGSDCPIFGCTVSKDGQLENRPCEHYLDGGGGGGGGPGGPAIGLDARSSNAEPISSPAE